MTGNTEHLKKQVSHQITLRCVIFEEAKHDCAWIHDGMINFSLRQFSPPKFKELLLSQFL